MVHFQWTKSCFYATHDCAEYLTSLLANDEFIILITNVEDKSTKQLLGNDFGSHLKVEIGLGPVNILNLFGPDLGPPCLWVELNKLLFWPNLDQGLLTNGLFYSTLSVSEEFLVVLIRSFVWNIINK